MNRWLARAFFFAVHVALAGCGVIPESPKSSREATVSQECRGGEESLLDRVPLRIDKLPSRTCGETLRFYEPFAAMAAAIYDPRDRTDEQLAIAAGSPWLQDQIMKSPNREALLERLLGTEQRSEIYRERIGRKCAGQKAVWTANAHDGAVRAARGECRDEPLNLNSDFEGTSLSTEAHRGSTVGIDERVPVDWHDCDYKEAQKNLAVPVRAMTAGWQSVPELQRRLQPRGWSVFVPGLVIDLWRRERGKDGESPVVEYALVFRGTAEGGGWLSNFRVLTSFTPLVWDQYRQAELATIDLINQIYQLHALGDALWKRDADTLIKITAVGHSLGGGLAQYVFLRVPQITRVVAFDPSPVTGASTFSPLPLSAPQIAKGRRERASVLGPERLPLDFSSYDEQASILVLYEQGEALTSLTGCASGPIWGDEGGPVVRCDNVNLSGGGAIRQHNMQQLACKIYLAVQGKPTRP